MFGEEGGGGGAGIHTSLNIWLPSCCAGGGSVGAGEPRRRRPEGGTGRASRGQEAVALAASGD